MNDLIIIKQLPIIEEKLKQKSNEIKIKVAKAKALVCTEDTVKEVKKVRTALKKELEEFEVSRKLVKDKIELPYKQFLDTYKEYILDEYDKADKDLKVKIDEVEDGLKLEMENKAREYFEEYKTSKNIDFITFEQMNFNILLGTTKKSLIETPKKFIDKVSDDLALIDTQEYKAEILVEYKQDLNVSKAITTVSNRHKAIAEEKAKVVEVEQVKIEQKKVIKKVESVSAPTIEEIPLIVIFKVTATKDKLKELKEFLNNGGYKYE